MSIRRSVGVFTFLLVLGATGRATIVDFEDAAEFGGDDAVVTQSYFSNYGLSVSAMAGADRDTASTALLSFEAQGRDGTDGFWTGSQGRDLALSGDLGSYFLKAGTGNLAYNKSRYFKMSIDYASATRAASGEVWDIDGKEQYQITAVGTSGATLATLTSPRGGLNGLPWTWSFDTESDEVGISTIEVSFASDQSTLRGFAFDNFNATQANPLASAVAAPSVGNAHAAPLPDAAVLIAVGLVGFTWRCRRRFGAPPAS